jgi:CheY-like chemotaxis protein
MNRLITRAASILLVEDNDDDAELTHLAFDEARVDNPLVRVRNGEEALDYLFLRGEYAGRPGAPPALVLLDLQLPRMSGIDVLVAIRGNDTTRRMPVVILTTSVEERDRTSAYDHFANSYVKKPVDHDQFVTAVRQLGLYWTVMNEPPPGDGR